MKKYTLLTIIAAITISISAQPIVQTVTVGKNMLTQTAIQGKEYKLKNKVTNLDYDSASHSLMLYSEKGKLGGLFFQNKGAITILDATTKEEKWSNKIPYNEYQTIYNNEFLYCSTLTNTTCIKLSTGEVKWNNNTLICFIDSTHRYGLGYRTKILSESNSFILSGIDLSNGAILWEKEMLNIYGWIDLQQIDANNILFINNGLFGINLKTGKTWEYFSITKKDKYNQFTAMERLNKVDKNMSFESKLKLHEFVSNIISDTSALYVSTGLYISKLDKKGEEIWSQNVVANMSSKASLYKKDSLILLVNYGGYNLLLDEKVNHGKPYIALFNAANGNQKYFIPFMTIKNPIYCFKEYNDTLMLAFKNKIETHSLQDGELINEVQINTKTEGEIRKLYTSANYYKEGSIFKEIQPNVNIYFSTSKDKVIEFNKKLAHISTISTDSICKTIYKTAKYTVIANSKSTYILNTENKLIAALTLSDKTIVAGSSLYNFNENKLTEIKLEDITEK